MRPFVACMMLFGCASPEPIQQDNHAHAARYLIFNSGSTVSLLNGSFECNRKKMRRAVIINPVGGVWIGCYEYDDLGALKIEWEDGDTLLMSPEQLRGPKQTQLVF